MLKPVGTLEEAHLICLENSQCISKTLVIGKDTYRQLLEEGHTFSEDQIHYLVSSNPRNAWHIENKIMSNSYGFLRHKLT